MTYLNAYESLKCPPNTSLGFVMKYSHTTGWQSQISRSCNFFLGYLWKVLGLKFGHPMNPWYSQWSRSLETAPLGRSCVTNSVWLLLFQASISAHLQQFWQQRTMTTKFFCESWCIWSSIYFMSKQHLMLSTCKLKVKIFNNFIR